MSMSFPKQQKYLSVTNTNVIGDQSNYFLNIQWLNFERNSLNILFDMDKL